MNRWIALSLRDFYGSEKKWQQETETKIEAKVIEAKTLQLAKERAQLNNNDPWIVFNISKTSNIIYAKQNEKPKERKNIVEDLMNQVELYPKSKR